MNKETLSCDADGTVSTSRKETWQKRLPVGIVLHRVEITRFQKPCCAQSLAGDCPERAWHLLKSCGGFRRCGSQRLSAKRMAILQILSRREILAAHLQKARLTKCDFYFALLFVCPVAVQFTRCGRLNNAPPPGDIQVLISRFCTCMQKLKGLHRCEEIKDVKTGQSSWIIQKSPL